MLKRMNPELLSAFEERPEWNISTDTINANRQLMDNFKPENPYANDLTIREEIIYGRKDAQKIKLRIYDPKEKIGKLPGVYFIHGGGFVMGSSEYYDKLCSEILMEIPSVIVSVDYRLPPETPYPGGLEDCYDGLQWFFENAESLGVDSSRIAVLGDSSGGGLTAALSLLVRDREGPNIAFQMPMYPMLDDRHITKSSTEIKDRRVWNVYENKASWGMYLGNLKDENVPVYAAPSRETDFSNLPPTYTFVGDLDPFRDETINYVAKLTQAGVPTEFHLYPGCYHGFEESAPHAEISKRAKENYFTALKNGLK